MKVERSEVERAHAIYTKGNLAIYDWWVLGLSNAWVWHCPTDRLLDLYRSHLTPNHLEVGVGTGYFPAKTMPGSHSRLALLDINRNCLEKASKRLAAFRPEVHQANVLEPLNLRGTRFDSIAVNYVLHCLPGRLDQKAPTVFDHLIPLLEEDGVIFGATLLGQDIQRPLLARLMMALYNRKGVFSNTQDSLGGLMEALSARFRTFNVEVRGCVVIFWGKGLRGAFRTPRSPL
jgi:hypothetical protein